MAIELIQNATAEYENHPTGGQAYTLDWTRQVFGPIGIVGIIFNLLIVITVSKLEMNKGSAITSSFRDPNKREYFTTPKLISHCWYLTNLQNFFFGHFWFNDNKIQTRILIILWLSRCRYKIFWRKTTENHSKYVDCIDFASYHKTLYRPFCAWI